MDEVAKAQLASSVEGTRLDRCHCKTEASSSFRIREPLQFAKQSNGTQAFPKSRNRVSHSSAIFLFEEAILCHAWILQQARERLGFVGERQPFEVLVRAFLETTFTTGNAEKAFGQPA